MFPPQKPKPKPNPGGPPDPFGGGPPPSPPGADPFSPVPAGGPAMPPGMDPFGGAAMPPLGGSKPGQGMDPITAMLGGIGGGSLGATNPAPQGPPMGPDGLPVGGSMPAPGSDPEMGGSPLLQSLVGSLGSGGGGDQYTLPPGGPDTVFNGIGSGDPQMGAEQLLSMLALAKMGVGGGPAPGSLAAGIGPQGIPGQTLGLGGDAPW